MYAEACELQRAMYQQSITRAHRGAFIFLLDGSGSMAEEVYFRGRQTTKSEVLATITNELLFELIERARRSEGIRDYYDIAVLGYSGSDQVCSLLPHTEGFCSVVELANEQPPLRTRLVEYRLPDGGISLREVPTPSWITPCASGQTPMGEAFRYARDLAKEWVMQSDHAQSFPPVFFNITDGEATDANEEELRALSHEIRSLRTADGGVLLINIHIAGADTPRSIFFPSQEEAAYPHRYASLLYDCSSPMPEVFNQAIREVKGPGAMPPFRGMSYNASTADLIAMLNIGSISVKTE